MIVVSLLPAPQAYQTSGEGKIMATSKYIKPHACKGLLKEGWGQAYYIYDSTYYYDMLERRFAHILARGLCPLRGWKVETKHAS
jgi:hypothetical protein